MIIGKRSYAIRICGVFYDYRSHTDNKPVPRELRSQNDQNWAVNLSKMLAHRVLSRSSENFLTTVASKTDHFSDQNSFYRIGEKASDILQVGPLVKRTDWKQSAQELYFD